jgi:hypothetical protein
VLLSLKPPFCQPVTTVFLSLILLVMSRSYSFTIGTPVPAIRMNQTVHVAVQQDTLPIETGWILFGGASGVVLLQNRRSVSTTNLPVATSASVAPGKYLFVITDSRGDGLSASPIGQWEVNVNGSVAGMWWWKYTILFSKA